LSHDWIADANFFSLLDEHDAQATAAAQAAGCPACQGRLDRPDYPRKPRGGDVAATGESISRRRSLCCAREGCRKRLTPPSLVFLGRRLYLAITVVVATWRATMQPPAPPPTSPPPRTIRRWLAWFAWEAPAAAWAATVRSRLSPPLEPDEPLPSALVARLVLGRDLAAGLLATLRLLAPLSRPTPR
jgi:hypothetical protein